MKKFFLTMTIMICLFAAKAQWQRDKTGNELEGYTYYQSLTLISDDNEPVILVYYEDSKAYALITSHQLDWSFVNSMKCASMTMRINNQQKSVTVDVCGTTNNVGLFIRNDIWIKNQNPLEADNIAIAVHYYSKGTKVYKYSK